MFAARRVLPFSCVAVEGRVEGWMEAAHWEERAAVARNLTHLNLGESSQLPRTPCPPRVSGAGRKGKPGKIAQLIHGEDRK